MSSQISAVIPIAPAVFGGKMMGGESDESCPSNLVDFFSDIFFLIGPTCHVSSK